jgi:hypothetical protein
MKTGIVTYWKSGCNYGEQLQCYALQEYLRSLGHEPFLIRYDYEADVIYGSRPLPVRIIRACNPKRLAGHFITKRNNKDFVRDCMEHPRGFESFREQHLAMSRVYGSLEELRNDPPEADLYIAGSDQIWNTFGGGLVEMRNRIAAFFLDFGKEGVKKISYAASWGKDSLPDDQVEYIKPLLAKFDAVSVREETGIGVCRKLGRKDAVLAPDPVLLHGTQKYRSLYEGAEIKRRQGRYLFFYYLNNGLNFDRQKVFEWARQRDLEVVYVTDDWHEGFERTFPGIPEWLRLIDDAEYVVTNSYHCGIFSILFGKKFGIIKRTGAHTGMNSRMETLFALCGINPRFIDAEDFEALERPVDTPDLEKLKEAERPEDIIEAAFRR